MLNHCTFIGNLGRDPEIRFSQSGGKIGNLNLAVTERWKDKQSGERKERTEWVRLVCYQDGLCGVMEKYLRKGSKVYVAGKMATRKWTDQSGTEKFTTEIILEQLVMLDGRQEDDGARNAASSTPVEDLSDSIPF